ncbi:hypothetical protein AAFF_G00281500 [Aldrovandia affinis]|uniref:Uncharacterized protein n=1 Tax=Aldrovandia affinis TaxID=143900 RepID=A0AAD7W1V4_9TELE|nr:hypothetical protein AAFF_G00281500 [Aldrovandia affinis]
MSIPVILLLLLNITLTCRVEASGSVHLRNEITPQEVRFHSLDYRNILHWKHHGHSHGNPHYFVQYKMRGRLLTLLKVQHTVKAPYIATIACSIAIVVAFVICSFIYGDKHWTNVTHCQGIGEPLCDLSLQTSEPRDSYYARVKAALQGAWSTWALSPRFNPHWDTAVSPPGVTLNVTKKGIVVRLRAPISPYKRRNGSRISIRKLQKMLYRIYLTHNNVVQEEQELESCVRELLITDLKPRTTYCLQAETHILQLGRTSARSQAACVTTP